MGTILKFPPCVRHVGHRPPQEMQSSVVDRALLNLRAPKAACKLMKFYAAQATGFRPSLKMIEEHTSIGIKYVSEVRQILVKRGLLGYDGRTVLIDWLRLSSLASMDTKLIGQRKHWNITPVSMDLLVEAKKPVHNYIGVRDNEARRLYAVYEATQQAIADGVKFPELKNVEVKKPVYNYIGNENLIFGPDGFQDGVGWYSPFDEPDPEWVYQCAVVDAYGEIVGYMHYDTLLPF